MNDKLFVFDPVAPHAPAEPLGRALDTLAGKVVGFIDNAKPNFNNLADDLGEILVERYGVRRVMKHQKRAPSIPAEDAVMRAFTAECDLIVTGSGD